jgi:enediyne biosynthesis protein E4
VGLPASLPIGDTAGAVAKLASSSAESISFTEASAALGVAESGLDTYGVAAYDWDGDGCDDLYVGRHRRADPRLYLNACPGRFTDEVARLNIPPEREHIQDRHGMAFADYDGDGREDLFITTGGGRGRGPGAEDQLYHQLPDGEFEDVAPAEGITDRPASGRFGLWFDYDRDDDLDLLVGHEFRKVRPEENRNLLWENRAGHFRNAGRDAGIASPETSSSGVAADLEGDRDTDLLTVPGQLMSLYTNRGDGTFAWTSWPIKGARSVAAGDYDNDGDLDLFVSRFEGNISRLFRNDGGGVWRNVTAAAGAGYVGGGAALWLDVDNDGWLDLFLARQSADGKKLPNVLLWNRHPGAFANVAEAAGVTGPTDSASERTSSAWGDFDRDRRVDLAVVTQWSIDSVQVYLNRSQTANGAITLRLRDPASMNRRAIGAKVWITTDDLTQYREVTATIAEWSQSPPYLIVGLGSSSVARLKIQWPDGTVSFADVPRNGDYTITKGQVAGSFTRLAS